jgi:nucleoid-associated protein YgaU
MGLSKLTIIPEKKDTKLVFDKSDGIEALFNPKLLTFNRSISWESARAAQRDVPELEFTTAQPATLSLELIFDTYDTPSPAKEDVRKKYTVRIFHLTTVEKHGNKHRPPVCRLRWGEAGDFFDGVLEKLDQKFTMFLEDGTPVRATLTCSFKEWRTNDEDRKKQILQSPDVAKRWIVKRGDTLSAIAAQEYLDPSMWRPIAARNNLDDPLDLTPGRVLLIPALTLSELARRRPPNA